MQSQRKRKETLELLAMILPVSILFLIFLYIPMAGNIITFRKYDVVSGLFGYSWIGLKNFTLFFRDPYCFRIIRNTVLLNFYMLLFSFPAPILLALFINEIRQSRLKKAFQSISYLPHFISTVIIVGIMLEIFTEKGIANQALSLAGIKSQLFFNDKSWFRPLYVGSSTWEGMGWNSIIYLAALAGINPELYENSEIEGAGKFDKIWHITLPGILPVIVILFILQIGSLMNVGFEKVFLMYNPGTYETADVISTYIYRRGIIGMDYSYATTVGIFNSAVNFILLILANYSVRKVGYGLW